MKSSFFLKMLKGPFILLLVALIWGVAFVAQREGMDHIGPFTFNFCRSLLGGIVLIPLILVRGAGNKKHTASLSADEKRSSLRTLIIGGISCGAALFAASAFQQIGIQYTSSGKTAFITALYIIFVPIMSVILHKRIPIPVWAGVVIAGVGMYLLCVTGDFSVGKGDWFVLACAVCFSVHIMVIDYFAPKVDCVKMACIQFFVSALLSIAPMLIFETVDINAILACWLPIAYAGIMSSGVAYTLQMIGQKYTPVAIAPLIMSLESVFAALAGWLIINETMSAREIIGCVLIFCAIILAQIPVSFFKSISKTLLPNNKRKAG